VLAALETDDPAVEEARRRFTQVMLETAGQIVEGRREHDVVEAAMALLELSEDEAMAHHACLISPTSGLTPDGLVDEASIATLVGLRRKFAPTPELDAVMESLSLVVDRRALRSSR
jgi:hypothetical protein